MERNCNNGNLCSVVSILYFPFFKINSLRKQYVKKTKVQSVHVLYFFFCRYPFDYNKYKFTILLVQYHTFSDQGPKDPDFIQLFSVAF